MKYKKNLHIEGSRVYSYNTHVATINWDKNQLYVHGYWSITTSKHINHVADIYGLDKIKQERDSDIDVATSKRKDVSNLKTIATVMKLGDIFQSDKAGGNQKSRNDWKARMLKAGLEGRGLIMPDDWDTLDEATKEARMDGVIGIFLSK